MVVTLAGLLVPAASAFAAACPPVPPFASVSDRIGVNVTLDYGRTVDDYDVESLRAGWYIDYARRMNPSTPGGMSYVQVLRTSEFDVPNWRAIVGELVDANPGGVWAIGNEMDRNGQDGRLADRYAIIYHDAYKFIKERDPSATVMVGAIVQPTPVRLLYLDMVLDAYEKRYGTRMPVEYWNMHGFILREAGQWGAFLPPGLGNRLDLAMEWDVPDHGRIELFKELVLSFRRWMNERGYRQTPLMVSEYGILMPPDYDAGNGKTYDYAFVRDYMLRTFEFMRDAVDPAIGYSQDGNRLVQAWAWYSLNDIKYDLETGKGFNGNLFDHDTGIPEPLANDFRAFTSAGFVRYTDVVVRKLEISPTELVSTTGTTPIRINGSVLNRGNLAAQSLRVEFWLVEPDGDEVLLGRSSNLGNLPVRCSDATDFSFEWTPTGLDPGFYFVKVVVTYQNSDREFDGTNNSRSVVLRVGPPDRFADVFVPLTRK